MYTDKLVNKADLIKTKILSLTREFYSEQFITKKFRSGDNIPYAGKVFDETELVNLVNSSLDFWLTAGRFANEFEMKFSKYMNQKYCLLVNSGSSANLIALSTLTSSQLGDRRLKKGDEVITVAAGFPTTVAPIVQNGLIPVFLDVEIGTYNIDVASLNDALTNKTKAIMIAHTLGNPFDVNSIMDFANKNNLWVIEDCCDAVGSTVSGRKVGTFGHIATTSFYPAHHITMGEGGSVLTNISKLYVIAKSFRDWGRDCYCEPGKDNTCGRRFSGKHGDLPQGYDHKFVYSHIGYNLKVTDMQASVGLAQLEKLDNFIASRKANFKRLDEFFGEYKHLFYLPKTIDGADPSWFGYPLTVKEDGPFNRNQLIAELNENNIMTRLIFAGNMIRQPAFKDVKYRIVGDLKNSDYIMNNTLFLGVYPGLDSEMLDFMIFTIRNFIDKTSNES